MLTPVQPESGVSVIDAETIAAAFTGDGVGCAAEVAVGCGVGCTVAVGKDVAVGIAVGCCVATNPLPEVLG